MWTEPKQIGLAEPKPVLDKEIPKCSSLISYAFYIHFYSSSKQQVGQTEPSSDAGQPSLFVNKETSPPFHPLSHES